MAPTPTLPLAIAGIFGRQIVVSPDATVTVVPPTTTIVAPTTTIVAPTTTTTVIPTSAVVANNRDNGLGTGEIVGIVIGVIVAILLIIWAIRALSAKPTRAPDTDRQGWYDDREPSSGGHRHQSRSRSRSHHGHHHHHHHRHRSSTPRPVVLEEKNVYAPRRPSATYAYPDTARRSRSQGRSRSRSGTRYYTVNQ